MEEPEVVVELLAPEPEAPEPEVPEPEESEVAVVEEASDPLDDEPAEVVREARESVL